MESFNQTISLITRQNNFFRQIRNFVIDITEMPFDKGACIHWQVAQATSLQNIEFNMRTDGKKSNKQMVREEILLFNINISKFVLGDLHG